MTSLVASVTNTSLGRMDAFAEVHPDFEKCNTRLKAYERKLPHITESESTPPRAPIALDPESAPEHTYIRVISVLNSK